MIGEVGFGWSVQDLYEKHPYPSGEPGSDPIHDVGIALDFLVSDMGGLRVLDAGCGSGHRLVGVAQLFPDTKFVGMDFSQASVAVAKQLAATEGVPNVEIRHAAIGAELTPERFDVAVCAGVLHHLPDPCAGLQWIRDCLAPDGVLYAWHYHSYGEHERLLDRELIALMRPNGRDEAVELMHEFGLGLDLNRYGTDSASASGSQPNQLSAAVDAYLHPIVQAFTFAEAQDLMASSFEWSVVVAANKQDESMLTLQTDEAGVWQGVVSKLFAGERLRERLLQVPAGERMRLLELAMKPTGFATLAGSGTSRCTDEVRSTLRKRGVS
jgi:SAM-dependent methyltransferase